jgi:hypothetical protein
MSAENVRFALLGGSMILQGSGLTPAQIDAVNSYFVRHVGKGGSGAGWTDPWGRGQHSDAQHPEWREGLRRATRRSGSGHRSRNIVCQLRVLFRGECSGKRLAGIFRWGKIRVKKYYAHTDKSKNADRAGFGHVLGAKCCRTNDQPGLVQSSPSPGIQIPRTRSPERPLV